MLNSFTIGSLNVLGVGNTNFWLTPPITGLEAPNYRITSYARAGDDGGIVSSAFYDTRIVQIQGKVTGSTEAQHEANRKLLQSTIALSRTAGVLPTLTRCTFTTLNGDGYFFDGEINSFQMSHENVMFSNFMIQFIVPNPFIFAQTQRSSGSISLPSGGGFILPVVLPITSASQTGGSTIAVNQGNGPAYPIITITGQMTTPYINNSTAGKSIQLNYTIAGGSSVVIDMYNKSIIVNGTGSILSTKSNDSSWWPLLSGNNNISISSAGSSDTGTVTLTWYDAFMGA